MAAKEEMHNALNLPPCDQVGFVHRDIARACKIYEPLFGAFSEIQEYGEMEWLYRGEVNRSEIKVAYAKSGDLEIELIEWVSGGTPHKEFLDAGREGMHHIRFIVPQLEEKVREAAVFGYHSIWEKRFGEGLAAAYLEHAEDPLLLEFFENHALAGAEG